MGLFDKIQKPSEGSMLDKVSTAIKDKATEVEDLAEKQKSEVSTVQELAGKKLGAKAKLWKQEDGLIYFQSDPQTLYEVVGFEWDGARYNDVTTTVGKESGKQKRKGRVIGATVGTLIAPGIGTAIGAAFGTGNKKTSGETTQTTTTESVEAETVATLTLRNVESGEVSAFNFKGMSDKLQELQLFAQSAMDAATTVIDVQPASDPYEELKRMKELLDMGVVSQEEFDAKKRQVLGI